MKSYVFIKIGGSSLMMSMITKVLATTGHTEFNYRLAESMIILRFESEMSRQKLSELFDGLSLVNYFLCEESDMSCSLTDKMNEGLGIKTSRTYHTDPVKQLAELEGRLKAALDSEEYEDASRIRDEIEKLKQIL